MASEPPERRPPARVRLPLWLFIVIGIFIVIGVAVSSVWLFRTVRDTVAANAGIQPQETFTDDTAVNPEFVATAVTIDGTPVATLEPLPTLAVDEIEPWSGEERVTFLLLGIDRRCDEEGPTHTDSVMVASVDPVAETAVLLSLPRDLWVDIPGFEVDRINQAFYFGQIYEYPGGGQALARETVENFLGIPVDHYITIDFQGFIDGVDLLGGIDMDIPEAIIDSDYPDNCYGYDPFSIEAGQQHLDGEMALKYARTRATFGGDVDRAGRQQAVILAVKDEITQFNQFPQLLVQAPELWRTFQENLHTNLALEDAVQLALLIQEMPRENIRTAVLDYDYVYTETTPDGRQVLVPRRDEIRELRNELFAEAPLPTPDIRELAGSMEDENAKVAVYNGTAVFGLAGETQEYLLDRGVNVTEVGNADAATYSTSQIIDFGANPQTIQFLIHEMGIPPLNFSDGDRANKPAGDFEVLVIIGNDWANQFAAESE